MASQRGNRSQRSELRTPHLERSSDFFAAIASDLDGRASSMYSMLFSWPGVLLQIPWHWLQGIERDADRELACPLL
jgi:hypothetical protein